MTKKILLCGFDAFDGDSTNPSATFIHWLNSRKLNDDRVVESVILPVTFDGAFATFKKSFDEFCPELVILTGLAKNRKTLTVERIGINWVDARIPDNSGVIKVSQKIDDNGPDGLFTTIPITSIIDIISNSGVAIKLSTSAGEYVCNELLYKVLCYTKDKNSQVTFIHIPGLDNYDGIHLALETLVNEI